jgi:hypothetical protein
LQWLQLFKGSTGAELADCRKTASPTVGKLETVSELGKDYDF